MLNNSDLTNFWIILRKKLENEEFVKSETNLKFSCEVNLLFNANKLECNMNLSKYKRLPLLELWHDFLQNN